VTRFVLRRLLQSGVVLLGVTLVAAWAARRLGGGLSGDVYGLLIVVAELLVLGFYGWGFTPL